VIFVVGDYTALIGDPTGRNTMRPPLTEEEITRNATTYTDQVFKMLDRERTRIERNSAWLGTLSFKDVVLLAAKYNVGRMLERRDFKERFESGRQIAVHEFLYPLMQGYDSVELKADVELGGHDQIFNLLVGRHLMEHYGQRPQCVLTVALLVGVDGVDKMSKSKGNHIGITEPADDMFGKVMSISDETMWAWYALLTDRSPDREQPLDAKKQLAHLLIERFHGKAPADSSLEWWNAGRPLREGSEEQEVEAAPLKALLVKIGLAESNADAFRKIKEGAATIDGERHSDPAEVLAPGTYLVRVGKKHQKRIRIVAPKRT
jgi:tyrosyl-tRNA synthetase